MSLKEYTSGILHVIHRLKAMRWRVLFFLIPAALCAWFAFCLPDRLFDVSYSTVLLDREGNLLNANVAADGQWRFPPTDNVPEKFKQALIQYEDKRFYSHPGIDPLAMLRAARQNFSARRIVSGGSTITMQVMRLAGKGSDRNIWNKLQEIVKASRLEVQYSKEEILALYAAHAPFGGNVVGIEAACWRYFGRQVDELSWGEAALLAVLPNNPSLMHLSRNRERLRVKRDGLLSALTAAGKIDSISYALAIAEELPISPLALPRLAPHLLTRASKEGHAQARLVTTLEHAIQRRATSIVLDHQQRLAGNHVYNAAAIVVDVNSGH